MARFTRNVKEVLQSLPSDDVRFIDELNAIYHNILRSANEQGAKHNQEIIEFYIEIGKKLQAFVANESHLHVFSFSQPRETHGQVSRLIAKLRNGATNSIEFTYYMQRAFEELFSFGFQENIKHTKNYFVIDTPVSTPLQNYAVHKLPNLDVSLHHTVMCVMLRGALLPSMIMAKEIQEYSSKGYVPDFALFRISRNDEKEAKDMEYIIKEESSYYDIASLQDKDLIFADPMNATGGSILTVLDYLASQHVKPRSIKLFHAISSVQGALQILRGRKDVELYTLWLDPVLNSKAYIMPGLGDAGDRLNGVDDPKIPRNIIQLIAYYGQNISQLYRAQIRKIEETILGKMT